MAVEWVRSEEAAPSKKHLVARRQAWNFMLSGGSAFDALDYSFSVGHEDGTDIAPNGPGGGSPALRHQLHVLVTFLQKLPLLDMTPDFHTVKHAGAGYARVLSNPGVIYALYLDGTAPDDLTLDLPCNRRPAGDSFFLPSRWREAPDLAGFSPWDRAETCRGPGNLNLRNSSMAFAVWIDRELAWAEGTHEYRAMGVGVVSITDLIMPRDFTPQRKVPSRADVRFAGLFASLVDVNDYLLARRVG